MSDSAIAPSKSVAEEDFFSEANNASNIFCHKKICFWKTEQNSLAAQIACINGKTFVGLSKFWRQSSWRPDRWAPAKKGHLYLTIDQWNLLCQRAPQITAASAAIDKLLSGKRIT